jgi:ribose 5-phosphate isomerase A
VSSDTEAFKRAAAIAAAAEIEDGMRLGLGTGSTVAHLLPAIAARGLRGLRCVATSVATERAAAALGIAVESFDTLAHLDLAIDGADQIAPDRWLVKGGGRAHTREKIVAASAARFVVIATAGKRTERLHAPVPLELHPFGVPSTLARLGTAVLRAGPRSPDGGVIADWTGPVDDPAALAARLDATPGVIAHGLFPPELVTDLVLAHAGGIEHIEGDA